MLLVRYPWKSDLGLKSSTSLLNTFLFLSVYSATSGSPCPALLTLPLVMGEKKIPRKTLFISLLVSNNARKCLVYGVFYKSRVNEAFNKPYVFLLPNNLLPMIALFKFSDKKETFEREWHQFAFSYIKITLSRDEREKICNKTQLSSSQLRIFVTW